MEAIELSPTHMAWVLVLAAITVGLLVWQRSGLAGSLAIAIGRMVLQLGAIGVVFSVVFAAPNSGLVLAIVGLMLSVATVIASNRIGPKIPHMLPLVAAVLVGSTAIALGYVYLLVLSPDPWYDPQYVIPLVGLLLSSASNAAALSGERLISLLNASRSEIETHLSLGASPPQAIAVLQREAVKAGSIPTINAMLIAGAATLPGVLSGLILGGIDPFQAALYQILVLVLLAFVSVITSLLMTRGIARQFFNSAQQFIPR